MVAHGCPGCRASRSRPAISPDASRGERLASAQTCRDHHVISRATPPRHWRQSAAVRPCRAARRAAQAVPPGAPAGAWPPCGLLPSQSSPSASEHVLCERDECSRLTPRGREPPAAGVLRTCTSPGPSRQAAAQAAWPRRRRPARPGGCGSPWSMDRGDDLVVRPADERQGERLAEKSHARPSPPSRITDARCPPLPTRWPDLRPPARSASPVTAARRTFGFAPLLGVNRVRGTRRGRSRSARSCLLPRLR
jgi:hypothetical protein